MSAADAPLQDHDAPAGSWAPPRPLVDPPSPAARPSAAEEARSLVAGTALGTLATNAQDGGPWASMVAFAALDDGSPVIVVSTLAEHGRNLVRDQRASLSVVAATPGPDPLDSPRLSLAGRVERVEGPAAELALAAYVAAIPPARTFAGFGDFTTWVLRVERVRWVGGYGRMATVSAEDYAAAQPDPVRPGCGRAVAHLNADHPDALLDMARAMAGYVDATAARCRSADRYGLDLEASTPRGTAAVRVGFDEPIDEPAGLRRATVRLTQRARGLAAAVLVGLLVVAAGGAAAPRASASTSAFDGRIAAATSPAPGPVAKKQPRYERVVTLSPFEANVVARLGVKPIAVGDDVGSGLPKHARLRGVRRIALSHPDGPNLEQLVRLKPDLVLSSPNWRSGSAGMRSQGIRVNDTLDPQRLGTVTIGVRKIASLLGRASRAKAINRTITKNLKRASAGITRRPSILLVLGVGRNTTAFLPNSWGGDVVARAGGRLLTAGLKPAFDAGIPGSFAPLSDEEVLRRDPDVIVVVPHGNQSSIQATTEFFRNKPGWAPTKAARDGRIHVADPDALLTASDDPARVVRDVRRKYLRN